MADPRLLKNATPEELDYLASLGSRLVVDLAQPEKIFQVDEDGNAVLGDDGAPVMVKNPLHTYMVPLTDEDKADFLLVYRGHQEQAVRREKDTTDREALLLRLGITEEEARLLRS